VKDPLLAKAEIVSDVGVFDVSFRALLFLFPFSLFFPHLQPREKNLTEAEIGLPAQALFSLFSPPLPPPFLCD